MMRRSRPKQAPKEKGRGESKTIHWELRPGGMLVQTREKNGTLIKVNVSHGSSELEVSVPAQSTFGELKGLLAKEVGLEPQDQRLMFKGKEKDDDECLHLVGIRDKSKVVLFENPASKERKLEEMKRNESIVNACKAVADVRDEVIKLAEKVSGLESTVYGGTKAEDQEFLVLTELLMQQLLKLDCIEAEGEARIQRKTEVRRIQSYVETLDVLKARNSNPLSKRSTVSVATQWEAFSSGFGSLTAPVPVPSSSTNITNDWEVFD